MSCFCVCLVLVDSFSLSYILSHFLFLSQSTHTQLMGGYVCAVFIYFGHEENLDDFYNLALSTDGITVN